MHRWLPPPRTGAIGDDVAGLVLTSTELPAGAVPARLVGVFGYPGTPPRPDGAWVEAIVRGQVGGRHLQLDSATDSALRIQPGFSGSPAHDRATNRVVGPLTATPPAASGSGTATRSPPTGCGWPDRRCSTPVRPGPGRAARGISELTILHVSDPQLGRHHLFGGNGLTPADQAHDTLFQRLHDDLDALAAESRGCIRT